MKIIYRFDMREVKLIGDVILEIATNIKYQNSVIAQWVNHGKKDNGRNKICKSFSQRK